MLDSQDDPSNREVVTTTQYDIGGKPFQEILKTSDDNTDVMGFVDRQVTLDVGYAGRSDNNSYNFNDDTLANFFERPVRLHTTSWSVGNYLNYTITPSEYFNIASVKNKLQNYELMSYDLHVKIVINATPFHFGMIMAGGLPDPQMTTAHEIRTLTNPAARAFKLSNRPYNKSDISNNKTLELTLPFISRNNYSRVQDVIDGVDIPWEVEITSPTPLGIANVNASPDITISTFVWATNVELTIPTSNPLNGRTKYRKAGKKLGGAAKDVIGKSNMNKARSTSNNIADALDSVRKATGGVVSPKEVQQREQNQDGVISNVASSASKLLGMATKVPVIGPYADVASGALSSLGKFASYFGFSRVPIETEQIYVKQMTYSNLALTAGPETVTKLTVDPDQGTSINPNIIGSTGIDELAFASIHQKETLISTVLWEAADLVDTELFWANVTPMYSKNGFGSSRYVSNTAVVAIPFAFWCGSMKYRFEVIASKYHNGRLRISYEPNGANLSPEYNVAYSKVIDIAESRDVEFSVPWTQPEAYKSHAPNLRDEYFIPPGGIKNYNSEWANGIIYLSVLNELTSPDASQPIYINVYASGGEDLHFGQPSSRALAIYGFSESPLQSSGGMRAPVHLDLFGHVLDDETIFEKQEDFFGETYTSFRPLLKRYSKIESIMPIAQTRDNDAFMSLTANFRNVPLRGGYNDATSSNSVSGPYCYHPLTIQEYVSNAFCFQRGCYRYKLDLQVSNSQTTSPYSSVQINRAIDSGGYNEKLALEDGLIRALPMTIGSVVSNSSLNLSEATLTRAGGNLWNGSYLTRGDQNTAIEYEIPFYTHIRYFPATTLDLLDASDEEWGRGHGIVVRLTDHDSVNSLNNEDKTYINRYVATGEDFSLYYYMGLPQLTTKNKPAVAIDASLV